MHGYSTGIEHKGKSRINKHKGKSRMNNAFLPLGLSKIIKKIKKNPRNEIHD